MTATVKGKAAVATNSCSDLWSRTLLEVLGSTSSVGFGETSMVVAPSLQCTVGQRRLHFDVLPHPVRICPAVHPPPAASVSFVYSDTQVMIKWLHIGIGLHVTTWFIFMI
jgi:hypothetical protein